MLCEEARSGAAKFNWETTIAAFSAMFETLPVPDAGALAMAYVKLYLPKFMEKNPEEDWVNERLSTIEWVLNGGIDSKDLPGFPDYTRKFADPLDRGFKSAIGSLWRMARFASDPTRFAESVSEAIAVTFTLLGYEYDNWLPAEYAHLRSDEKSYMEFQADLWCDLADKMASLVSPSESFGLT